MSQQKYITVYFLGEITVTNCVVAREMDAFMSFNSNSETWSSSGEDVNPPRFPTSNTYIGAVYWSTTVNGSINDIITLAISHQPNFASEYLGSALGGLTPEPFDEDEDPNGINGVPTGGDRFVDATDIRNLGNIGGGNIIVNGTVQYFFRPLPDSDLPQSGFDTATNSLGMTMTDILIPESTPNATSTVFWRIGGEFTDGGGVSTGIPFFARDIIGFGNKVYWRMLLTTMTVPGATWVEGKYVLPIDVTCAAV